MIYAQVPKSAKKATGSSILPRQVNQVSPISFRDNRSEALIQKKRQSIANQHVQMQAFKNLQTLNRHRTEIQVVQRQLHRGSKTGWGFFGWVDDTAQEKWIHLVDLYDVQLPDQNKKLKKLSQDYPGCEAEIKAQINKIENVILSDVTVAYAQAEDKKKAWEQLIQEAKDLCEKIPVKVKAQQAEMDELKQIKNNAWYIYLSINKIHPEKDKDELFPSRTNDGEKLKQFKKDIENLVAGSIAPAILNPLKVTGGELKTTYDAHKLTLSLILKAQTTEQSTDDSKKRQKNLIKLRTKGASDSQLAQLLDTYKAKPLEEILKFADATQLIKFITEKGLDGDDLYNLYTALKQAGQDPLIEDLLKHAQGQKVDLVTITSRSKQNAGGYLIPLLKVADPTTLKKMTEPTQGSLADANEILITAPAIPTATIQGLLASNGGNHTVPCLRLVKDSAFLTAFDGSGINRATMLSYLQMLNQTPAKLQAFVLYVKGAVRSKTDIENHLNLRAVNNKGHIKVWPTRIINSFAGDEQIQINAAIAQIPAGPAPAMPRHNGAAGPIKFGDAWRNLDGDLPPPINVVGHYQEFYVQKAPADSDHGKRRIIRHIATNNLYYTNDHYTSFYRIR